MFDIALTSTARRTSSVWSLPFAAALHLAAGLLLIGASYLTLEVLPGPELPDGITLYLPAAPPAPPPGPPAPRAPQSAPAAPREPQERTQPLGIPERLPLAEPAAALDQPGAEPDGDGVDGVPGGDPFGVPGGFGDGGSGSVLGAPGGAAASAEHDEPLAISGDVLAPRLARSVAPDYPNSARLARVQGAVRLRAVIDETGAIENVTVLEGHPLLVAAATEAVAKWRYRPAKLDGRPVRVWVVVTVHFTLE